MCWCGFLQSSPSIRVVIATLPPFITADQIRNELSRVSREVGVLSAGFQADAVKHV